MSANAVKMIKEALAPRKAAAADESTESEETANPKKCPKCNKEMPSGACLECTMTSMSSETKKVALKDLKPQPEDEPAANTEKPELKEIAPAIAKAKEVEVSTD